MKKAERFYYLILILVSVWGLLNLAPEPAFADGGGWPTGTPTQTVVPAQIIVQPAGKDEIVVTPTPTVNLEAAPLPDAPVSGDQLLPGIAASDATATSSSLLPTRSTGISNFRFFATAGILLVVIVVIGFIVFRLRA